MAIFDPCLIDRYVVQHSGLFGVGEKLGRHRTVRNAIESHQTDQYRYAAHDDKHDSPAWERRIVDKLETEGDKPANDLACTNSSIEDGESWCLFRLGIPLTNKEHEARRHGRFEYGKEKPGCQ